MIRLKWSIAFAISLSVFLAVPCFAAPAVAQGVALSNGLDLSYVTPGKVKSPEFAGKTGLALISDICSID